MPQVEFGVFDWIERNASPLHQLYEDRLELLEAADAAGFYCYHLAEHHATPLSMAPSPALFLAAAAQRTQQIRLGPLVYLLPLYDPLRLIGEVCMLDQISRGRLELGVGRGVSPYQLRYYGVDPADARAIFNETLETLIAGLTHDRLNVDGKYHRYQDVPMELQPHQRPYPALWYPTHNMESMPYVARHGFNYVDLGPATGVHERVDAYWRIWEQHRHEAGRLNAHVAVPKVGVLRQLFVAETDDEAMAVARPAYADFNHSILKLWHDHGDHAVDALFDWDTAMRLETVICGSPVRVREQLSELVGVSGCNYVVCSFAWGTLPHQQTLKSLQLFTQEIMPAFQTGSGRN